MNDDQTTWDDENQKRHQGVILEDIQHQVKRLAEAMADVPGDVKILKEKVGYLEADIKVVKAAVTDTSKQVADHEHRITALETV